MADPKQAEHHHHRSVAKRSLGSPALFAIVYTSVAAAIYFSLGVVAEHALGMTPFVFLVAGLMFVLAAMTYVEGSSLHQDRGGSTVFARYAFNELWSLHRRLGDPPGLRDPARGHRVLGDELPGRVPRRRSAPGRRSCSLCFAILGYVVVRNIRGFSTSRVEPDHARWCSPTSRCSCVLIVLGFALFFDLHAIIDPIHLGTTPQWDDVIFAARRGDGRVHRAWSRPSGLAGEVAVGRRGAQAPDRRARSATIMIVYVGIATVALMALPVRGNETSLVAELPRGADARRSPRASTQHWLRDTLKYVVAAAAAATLIAAANSAMLGLSRLAYSLSTNRQIPSGARAPAPDALRRRSSLIVIAAAIAGALTVPQDLDFLRRHLRVRRAAGPDDRARSRSAACATASPTATGPTRCRCRCAFRGGELPLPAVLGAVLSFVAWVSVIVLHAGARYVGFGWMAAACCCTSSTAARRASR